MSLDCKVLVLEVNKAMLDKLPFTVGELPVVIDRSPLVYILGSCEYCVSVNVPFLNTWYEPVRLLQIT